MPGGKYCAHCHRMFFDKNPNEIYCANCKAKFGYQKEENDRSDDPIKKYIE